MVDQIQTTGRGRTETDTETESDSERSAAIATLRRAERYDHVRVAPLDLSLRVLHQIGDFGVEGIRATGDDTTYLLVAESDPELPDVRIDRYDGSTFRPVFRTSQVRVDEHERGGETECVFRVPAGVRVDRDRRTAGRIRLQPDGGLTAVQTARDLSAGDRVRVAGEEHESMLATVDRVDDSPPVASELFAGARHVFLDTDADGERIRVLTYRTATGEDALHLATPDGGLDGTWQRSGACTRLERVERASP
ncbi:hypothetical protein [Halorubrum sp. CSM-61]|uniref:hypothetical protein n=1 Tax=Halorubrum sp. CSM-61 TaxID=2485838 RepID=UPI000F4CEBC6|nr:hypothetical protein [Halorubrum sp. CSM-61]